MEEIAGPETSVLSFNQNSFAVALRRPAVRRIAHKSFTSTIAALYLTQHFESSTDKTSEQSFFTVNKKTVKVVEFYVRLLFCFSALRD